MAYLPPRVSEDIAIPVPLGRDYSLQIRLIEAKWNRFFPNVPYHSLVKKITPETDPMLPGQVGGEAGATIYDPLYNEAVDPQMLTTGYQQPHLSGILKAGNPEVYAPPVMVRARVLVDVTDAELHQWGFDKNLGLILQIPVSLLDKLNITAKAGDYVDWGGDQYEVIQVGPNARFLNTSASLYVVLNCQSRRQGS